MKQIIYILFISILYTACTPKQGTNFKIEQKNIINKNKIIKKENTNIKKDVIINTENNTSIIEEESNTLAIIYSSKTVGKYSLKIADIASLYMINSKKNFSLKFIDIKDETKNDIYNSFDSLIENNVSDIMFYITSENANLLNSYPNLDLLNIYLPLVNINDIKIKKNNIVYGGIDYDKQLKAIKSLTTSHIVEIYDNNYRNKILHNKLDKTNVTSYILSGKYPNYKRFLNKHKLINDSSLIINLDIVKSSILLSQMTAYEKIKAKEIFSTQNNFTPLLFALTQKNDTKKLILTNSILYVNEKLFDIYKLNNIDIKYNWVNYSTIIGLEYLLNKKNILFNNIEIKNNQVNYLVNLYKTNKKSFTLIN